MKFKSEFGKGLVYNLGLFLAHQDRFIRDEENFKNKPELEVLSKNLGSSWFNASKDHLYELEIPKNFPEKLKNRISDFRTNCIDKGSGFDETISRDDVFNSLRECKDILMEIDKFIGVESCRGEWE